MLNVFGANEIARALKKIWYNAIKSYAKNGYFLQKGKVSSTVENSSAESSPSNLRCKILFSLMASPL